MRFRIHFRWPDGTEDSIVVQGSLEECQKQAASEMEARRVDPDSVWSEEI